MKGQLFRMSSTEPIDPNVDPYGYLGLVKNPDGTITRSPDFSIPTIPANPDGDPILSKDVSINKEKKTFVRVFLPRSVLEKPTATKLNLIIYILGGGFVMDYSPASNFIHQFCSNFVEHTPSVIVSVSYRLAPEHSLPAAYDDCMEAIQWVRTTNDEWLTKYADFSKCFLVGTSAGGNTAYHIGLHSAACVDQLMPLKIRGMVLHHAGLAGVKRTPSEIRLKHDEILPLIVTDLIWELTLPIGADRDHEYSNPIKHLHVDDVDKVKDAGLRFLVTGTNGDPLIDRQVEVAKVLRERGVDVMEKFDDGGYHTIEMEDADKATILYGVIKNFMLDS